MMRMYGLVWCFFLMFCVLWIMIISVFLFGGVFLGVFCNGLLSFFDMLFFLKGLYVNFIMSCLRNLLFWELFWFSFLSSFSVMMFGLLGVSFFSGITFMFILLCLFIWGVMRMVLGM